MKILCYSSFLLFRLSKTLKQVGRVHYFKSNADALAIMLSLWSIRLRSSSADVYEFLGNIYLEKNQLPEAIKYFRKALENDPIHPFIVYNHLAQSLLRAGHTDDAIQAAEQSISFNAGFCWPYLLLGEAFLKKRNYEKAIEAYRKFVGMNPNVSQGYHGLGSALFQGKWFEEAIQPLRNAIEFNPDFRWSYHDLSEALSETGKSGEAIRVNKKLMRMDLERTHPHFRNHDSSEKTMRPNFLIIGQAKCGTTSLYHFLTQHPQVLPAVKKEIHFCSEKFHCGLDWYASHFPPVDNEAHFITGEASASYLDSEYAPERFFEILPDVKLIILLRNPVDRAYSDYNMRVSLKEEHRSWQTALDEEFKLLKPFSKPAINREFPTKNRNYLSCSIYDYSIKNWLKFYDREQLLILKSEDFYAETQNTVNRVFEFLGIAPMQLSGYRAQNTGSYEPLSEPHRQLLTDFFRLHNQRLEEFLGMKFNWNY